MPPQSLPTAPNSLRLWLLRAPLCVTFDATASGPLGPLRWWHSAASHLTLDAAPALQLSAALGLDRASVWGLPVVFASGPFLDGLLASVRAVVAGLRSAPGVPLDSPDAGIFRGMRPAFVVFVLVPLAVAAVVVWAGV